MSPAEPPLGHDEREPRSTGDPVGSLVRGEDAALRGAEAVLSRSGSEAEALVLYNSRAPRPGEQSGVDYHFRTREQVDALRAEARYVVLDVRGDLQALDLNDLSALLQRGDVLFEATRSSDVSFRRTRRSGKCAGSVSSSRRCRRRRSSSSAARLTVRFRVSLRSSPARRKWYQNWTTPPFDPVKSCCRP